MKVGIAYLLAVVGISFVHSPLWLSGLLLCAVLFAGTKRWSLLYRSAAAVLLFNLSVTLSFFVLSGLQGASVSDALWVMNLRVFLLAFLGFWFVSKVRLLDILAPWPTWVMLFSLAVGHLQVFRLLIESGREAFISRNLRPPRWQDRAHHLGAQGGALLDKAHARSAEVGLAMRSRGVFDG